ncbi:putative methyltransferase PMT26 [Iris pallida]|uniref:Methyltransferase PMT26 n=1 Tax=Iris pallida TaxID=29817 RepID=A0AAX6FX28_IRIPA|nr:putative methyltransferase PMT26 [Iris pallida]
MPFSRNSRLDPRRSSSYCSTPTIVVFVALCLVGIWVMTSPTEDMSPSEKQQLLDANGKTFADSNNDVTEDAMGEDVSTNLDTGTGDSSSEASQDKSTSETTDKSSVETTQRENPTKENEGGKYGYAETSQKESSTKENEGGKDDSVDTSKTGSYSDANGDTGGGEMAKEGGSTNSEGGNMNTEGQEDGQDKFMEKASNEPTDTKQKESTATGQDADQTETATEQKSGELENTDQNKNTDNKSDEHINDEQQQSNTDNQEEKSDGDPVQDEKGQNQIEKKEDKETKQDSDQNKTENQTKGSAEVFPSAQPELLNETNTQNGAWSTQAAESRNEKQVQASSASKGQTADYRWKLCHVNVGADYIPCLDNEEAIKKLKTTSHYEHRERHCPETAPTCLVPLPDGYRRSIAWPSSRDKIWYYNVPHTQLATVKGHQNWVKVSGEYLTFPGGGTQFKHGALYYIDKIQEAFPDVAWGKQSRVVLDVGCGVASLGGFLFDRDVLTMSFAPKDEHEAQVQFALERGIPAISAVMGTKRLPYPARVFDVIHCARCRVPWHIEGGMLLLELNRVLRPGGYFVWSATPVYQKLDEDVEIWKAMEALTKSMCWEMVAKTGKDPVNRVGLAIYRKPLNNSCYEKRKENSPPLCQESDDPNAAWNVPLQACMHRLPVDSNLRGSKWPEQWPERLEKTPYWLNSSQVGVYGKPAPEDFQVDQKHWNHVVSKSYLNGMGIDWSKVRNVMDMRSVYGGFAAALRDMKVWVMNVVPIDSPDTLPIIYERGLFGMYHDWCESFSTYPRSYDLLHADHLFSRLKTRCKLLPVMVEVDRMLRPEGKLIVRDNAEVINEVEKIAKSLHWEIRMTFSKKDEGLICVMKSAWRPKEVEETPSPASKKLK